MTRTMYDSVDVSRIPSNATMVAGYIDGKWQTVGALRQRFPHARVVTITVLGTAGADVADCEVGDLSPASAARWAQREIQAGRQPTIYCNRSTWPLVKAAVSSLGITGKVSYWIATDSHQAVIPAGAVAAQYLLDVNNLDTSVVADYWPGVDPKPTPPAPQPHVDPPTPTPVQEDKVQKIIRVKGTDPQFLTDGITRRWIEDPAEFAWLQSIGVITDATVHDQSAAMVNRIPIVGPQPK